MPEFSLRNCKVAVIGLGYVGLPLAVEFGKHYRTVGFDIKTARVAELKKGRDSTLEVDAAELRSAKLISYTTDVKDLRPCQVYIVTVPTPIDGYKRPDLTPIVRASGRTRTDPTARTPGICLTLSIACRWKRTTSAGCG